MDKEKAYRMGWAAQARPGNDWDDALARFSTKYCTHHPGYMCDIEHCWADGWDDHNEANFTGPRH